MKTCTPDELRIVYQVVEEATQEALNVALTVVRNERAVKLAAIHASFASRLERHGVEPGRAEELARTIRIDVDVGDDAN
jgi:hypothetical protein